MKRIKHILEYIIVISVLPVLGFIPYRLRIIAGKYLGIAVYYLYKKRRNIALENISESFPELDREVHQKICRESFANFGKTAMEFLQLRKLDDKFLRDNFEVEGEEHVRKALENGRGIVGVCPHLGNWEFVAAYFGMSGYPLSVIMKRQSNPYINGLIEGIRGGLKMGLIYKTGSGLAVSRALKENKIVAFVSDQDAGKNGVFVDFLGRPASTAQGPARFALSRKSPVIIFTGIREKKGKIRIIVSPLSEFDYNTRDKESSVKKNTELWVKKIEDQIRKYPGQYFWMHRRWKSRRL
jgi:Kdo2-lipid IVA lauroyltransferase/acyltransferase